MGCLLPGIVLGPMEGPAGWPSALRPHLSPPMCLLGFEVLQALVPVQVCVPGITENQKGPSLSLWLPPGLLGSEGTALLSALHCPPRPLAVGCLGEALGHCVVKSL